MATQRALKLAVIGLGYWGPNLVRNAQATAGFQLQYLCDVDIERAHRVLGRYSTVRASASLDEVLADPAVDAIAVATPAATHHAGWTRGVRVGTAVVTPVSMRVGGPGRPVAERPACATIRP